jgi:hypothetical protein
MRSIAKVGEDGSRACPAKVAWSSLILPKNCGGLKLIDPELQMKALLVKLLIRGLLPGLAPWRYLIMHRIKMLSPSRGGSWPASSHYLLFAVKTRGARSEFWQGLWKAWVGTRTSLKFQHPSTLDEVLRQPLFWNGEILNSNDTMIGDTPYAFGCLWARKGICTVHDLWDTERRTWRRIVELSEYLGKKIQPERYEDLLTAIPSTWCTGGDLAFVQFEWVASIVDSRVKKIYQLVSPHQGFAFHEVQPQLYIPCSTEPVDITGLELRRVQVAATAGDLKETQLNPISKYLLPVWFMGLTKDLQFDPGEWRWASNEGEVPFFNYTAKIGYQVGMCGKSHDSRLHEKCRSLNLSGTETQAAISLIWDENKPAKLQFFAWQVALGGLYTGSHARYLGYIGDCVRCRSRLLETTEHCLSLCSFSC